MTHVSLEPHSKDEHAVTKTSDDNNIKSLHKKITNKNHNYCAFGGCPTCQSVGPALLKMQLDNLKHILIDDDSTLVYNLFGKDLMGD